MHHHGRRYERLLWIGLALAAAACGGLDPVEQDAVDGPDDAFLVDGKADTAGISEGTPEAKAVLAVASTATLAQLKDTAEAGLYAKAAEGIVAARQQQGAFTSLAALDAVPYVGPVAFWKLVDYATRKGYLAATGKIFKEGQPVQVGADLYVLQAGLLVKQHSQVTGSKVATTILWQLSLKADHLAYDAARSKLIAFGPSNLYLVNTSGWVEQSFDEGYADLPSSSWAQTAASSVCASYEYLASSYSGSALVSFMVGNVVLGYSYQFWATYFENLIALYC